MASGTRQASIASESFQSWRNDLAHTLGEDQRYREPGTFVQRAVPPPNPILDFSRRSRVDSPSLTAEESRSSEEQHTSPAKRVTIGIDYGTTFSGISYAILPLDEDDENYIMRGEDIKTIKCWPDEPTGLAQQCPTELWYPTVAIPRAHAYNQFDAPNVIPSAGRILYDDGEEEEEECPTSFAGSIQVGAHVNREAGASVVEEGLSDDGFDDDRSTNLLWGYSVSEQQYGQNSARNPSRLIRLPKLMMLSTSYTEGSRKKLRYQINDLLRKNIIRKHGKKNRPDMRDMRDISTDYLVRLLGHTKEQLAIHEGYTEDWHVTFAIAVPAIWSPEASRILQFSMEAAILATGFGSLTDGKDFGALIAGSIDNLFIAPEPECGATWLLHNTNEITTTSIVTSLDCGGGTVDAVTYEVDRSYPVRLGRVVVEPLGDNCGSSYLNENFKVRAKYRLRDEKYLEDNGDTLTSIVDRLCVHFENFNKRSVDITSKHPYGRFYISKLRGDKAQGRSGAAAKGFENNILVMERDDYEFIFIPILKRVWNVLQRQLDAAFANNEKVEKIFLFGGFAASPSLVNYLKNNLKRYEKHLNLIYHIRLIEDPQKTVNAISSGAVLRALDTTHGPPRLGQSSYGFLRKEPYQKDVWQGHKRIFPERDEVDGELYVTVINYFMIKERVIYEKHEFKPIRCFHTFQVEDLDMKCEELLYVSDRATESHYKLTSKKNRDAQVAWKIITDMTFLKKEGHIGITEPKPDEHGVVWGQPHYVVEYDLVPIAEKRNLRLEARWPASRTPEERSLSGHDDASEQSSAKRRRIEQITVKVQMTAQLSIAAAFQPGTA